jgi:hypothetical protein
MKTIKRFKVTCSRDRGSDISLEDSLEELIQGYSYTLECGQSYQNEKGNKKINTQPKSIKTLITNLNNAVNNSAANGYAGRRYSFVEL